MFFPLVLFFFCFGCNNNKQEKTVVAPPPPPKYYFYPKANVYFDSVNKEYVFLAGDGKTWQTEKQIPAAMQTLMDKSILIDTPSSPVWRDNNNHKLVYSVLLYASPTDTREIKKLPPAPPKDTVEKKKERKGLKKFLDKIFGKKKKKDSAQ